MAEVQEQTEQATQQPQPQPEKKANWWKRGVLIGAGAFVLMVGGCSILVGLVAIGSDSSAGNGHNQPAKAEGAGDPSNPGKQADPQVEAVSQSQPEARPEPPTKTVKIVATSLDGPADYSASDDRWKIADGQQIEGTRTFTYENIPEKDGLLVSLINMKNHAYVAVEVYEDGKLVAQDDDNTGWAQVSY